MEYNFISFPGIGIGEMKINKIALDFGNIEIRWYGVIIAIAMVCGFALACFRAKKKGISFDTMLDYGIFVIVSAIIGARLYYVIFDKGGVYESFIDVIAIWNGGLAIYGGLIAGLLAIIGVSKFKKISIPKMLDIVAPCAMLGQAIGRFANFMNAEAYGYNSAKPALYEDFFLRMDIREPESTFVRHTMPTFLLESVWNIIGLVIILFILERFKKYEGQTTLFYVTWYGFGRMWIEMLRADSLYIFGDIRVSSLLGFLCFIAGVIMMIYFGARAKQKKRDSAEYVSMYSDETETSEESTLFEKEENNTEIIDKDE